MSKTVSKTKKQAHDDTSISLAPLDFEEVLKGMMQVKPKTNEEVKEVHKKRKVSKSKIKR